MQHKSIYKYASEAGLPMGIYLTLMSFSLLLSVKFQILSTFLLPLTIVFPFFLGFLIRKISRIEPSYMKFSSLWLGGIYTVIFGTLICMFSSMLYLTFIEPGFIGIYCNNLITTIESSPLAEEYMSTVEVLRRAKDSHLLPSAFDFITTMGWLTCFTGSIFSLVIALILSRGGRKVENIASR